MNITQLQQGISTDPEPRYYWCAAQIQLPKGNVAVKGVSFRSKKEAAMKCLMEAHEWTKLSAQKKQVSASASHTKKTSAQLHALYEAAERRQKFYTYARSIQSPNITLKTVPYQTVKRLYTQCVAAGIEWHLFDIAHGIGIPVYLTILISNRTTHGQLITFGARASFYREHAISDSYLEALAARPWLRKHMRESVRVLHRSHMAPEERAILWTHKSSLPHAAFLLKQDNVEYGEHKNDDPHFGSDADELAELRKKLRAGGIQYKTRVVKSVSSGSYTCFVYMPEQNQNQPIFPHPFI
jgi:ribosomal protein S12 methylthiotransferase accessory factor YcaO